jgi:hypothetical protein
VLYSGFEATELLVVELVTPSLDEAGLDFASAPFRVCLDITFDVAVLLESDKVPGEPEEDLLFASVPAPFDIYSPLLEDANGDIWLFQFDE